MQDSIIFIVMIVLLILFFVYVFTKYGKKNDLKIYNKIQNGLSLKEAIKSSRFNKIEKFKIYLNILFSFFMSFVIIFVGIYFSLMSGLDALRRIIATMVFVFGLFMVLTNYRQVKKKDWKSFCRLLSS